MKQRAIIFGCGYVGRALADELVRRGWETWIHSRNADSLRAVQSVSPGRHVLGDLHSGEWHDQLNGDWDVVFNLVSSAGGGLDGYRLSYLEGNRSIMEWAGRRTVRRFVYTSATSVYPQTDGEWVNEDDVPVDLEGLSPSGRILRESELEILASAAYRERVVARLAGIYGPGRHLYLNSLREGADRIPGDGSGWLNLVYLADIIRALVCIAEASLSSAAEVFNVLDNHPARKQEIVDWLAAELGMESIPFDPDLAGPRTARRRIGGALPNRRVSNRKIRESLGWEPAWPDFKAGYRDILAQA